jgi:hypothetical protein
MVNGHKILVVSNTRESNQLGVNKMSHAIRS